MIKITIPALLVATIMVAGAFAFMPVEQASTVHLSGTVVFGGIDVVTDAFIDASTGAVSISAGSEAADSVDGEISFDAADDILLDTDAGAGGIEISAGAETAADPVNDVLALNSLGALTITSTGAATITIDADAGADGTVIINGESATTSDKLQFGTNNEVILEKTAANVLDITGDVEISGFVGFNGADAVAAPAYTESVPCVNDRNSATADAAAAALLFECLVNDLEIMELLLYLSRF